MTDTSARVASLLDASVKGITEGREVAVAFSGGIDSGLVAALAKRHAASVTLYTVGTEGSHDVAAAREVAPLIGADLVVVTLRESDILDNLREEIAATGTDSPLVLAFDLPLMRVMREAKEGLVIGGQGSDEQFAGYSKYIGRGEVEMREEMVRDMSKLYKETLPHEKRLAEHFGKEVAYPFLDRDLVSFMRSVPSAELAATGPEDRKRLLSQAAEDLGLGFLAGRQKKAAQYGSGAMDAIKRTCRRRGIKYNGLVSQLVREAASYRD